MNATAGKYTLLLLIMALTVMIDSCSNKTLSIFFDGVPPEEDTAIVASIDQPASDQLELLADNSGSTVSTRKYYHTPYREKECASCHDQNAIGKLNLPQPDLCYQCHDDFSTLYTVLHAPVEAGGCTDCHNPHLADSRMLLRQPVIQLCFSCHDQDDETWKSAHEGLEGTKCTECHNPHGGSDNSFLN